MDSIVADTGSGLPRETAEAADRRSASWDIRNAPKTYLALIVTHGAGSFFAFVSVWLLTKTLGSEGYGGVIAIFASSQIAQILVNWTGYAVVRFGTQEFVETGRISRIFWLRVLALLSKILVVLLSSALWFPPIARWLELPAETLPLVALHFAASAIWLHVQMALQSVKKQKLQGSLLAVERLLLFIAMLALLQLGKLSVMAAALVYGTLPLVMAVGGLVYLSPYIFGRFSISYSHLRTFLRYSLPLLPFGLVGVFSTSYIDAVFVARFLSQHDLGVYSIAVLINGFALQIPTLANSILIPLFVTLQTERKSAETTRYFTQIVPSLVLGWAVLCTVAAFVLHFAVPIVFGETFREAQAPIWVLFAASTIALPVMVGYSALSNSTSTTQISMFAAAFSAVANVAANFLLIPRYGMIGCSWATAIAFGVSLLTFSSLLHRAVHLPLSWTLIATLPSIGAAVAFTATGSPGGSLATGLIIGCWLVVSHSDSLRSTVSLLRGHLSSK